MKKTKKDMTIRQVRGWMKKALHDRVYCIDVQYWHSNRMTKAITVFRKSWATTGKDDVGESCKRYAGMTWHQIIRKIKRAEGIK